MLRDGPGIFPIRPFSLSRPIKSTYEEQSRKGPRHNLDLSRKSGKHPALETPQFSFSQHAKWRCDIPPPPPQKGYLSDICRIPHETRQNGCDTPSAVLSRKGIARYAQKTLPYLNCYGARIRRIKFCYRRSFSQSVPFLCHFAY